LDILHIIALAVLQGLTEFLPISSSAHLILLPSLLGWQDQGLAFDISLHIGSLIAVLAYFRHDLIPLGQHWLGHLRGQAATPQSRLAWAVLWGTVPVGLAGLALGGYVEANLRSPLLIAWTTLIFGILLGLADWLGKRRRSEYHLSRLDVLAIGVAQAVALIPGVSRSGITMTAGLAMGLQRAAAARYSFLLSVPVTALAGGLSIRDLLHNPAAFDWPAMLLGAAFSGLSAYLCIKIFMRFLEQVGMWPFVVYRIFLGIGLLIWLA
jgi:undecaprenyl-diphosphatase